MPNNVQLLQQFLKSNRPVGIGYPLPPDGEVTPELLTALSQIHDLLEAQNNQSIPTLTPQNALSILPQFVQKNEVIKSDPKSSPKSEIPQDQSWIDFFSQSLPLVGKLYNGSLSQTAQKLENLLSKELNQNLSGVIFNSKTQTFLTSPEDIKTALSLLEKNKSKTSSHIPQDQKFLLYAQKISQTI